MTDAETIQRLQRANDVQSAKIETLKAQLGRARAETQAARAEWRLAWSVVEVLRRKLGELDDETQALMRRVFGR